MRELDFEGLRDELDGLGEKRVVILAHHGELSYGGDHRLLLRARQQKFFRLLAFKCALLQGFRHAIERVRELPQFALGVAHAGATAEISFSQFLRGVEEDSQLAQDEPFTTIPSRSERKQSGHEAGPFRQFEDVDDRQRGNDSQKNSSNQANAESGERIFYRNLLGFDDGKLRDWLVGHDFWIGNGHVRSRRFRRSPKKSPPTALLSCDFVVITRW